MLESNDLSFRSSRGTRRNVATSYDDVEFIDPRATKLRRPAGPKVNYVDSVKKSKTKSRRKRKAKSAGLKIHWTWSKIAWCFAACLLLRLVFMEGGVIDFNKMDNVLLEKKELLIQLKKENKELAFEIKKMRTSPAYQRKITRDHLGVIAKDEYLILFAKN